MTDLTIEAQQATRRARLAEQVLLDRVQARAVAEQKLAEPKGFPVAAVVFTKDTPPEGALIADRPYHARAGELRLVDAGHAQVLKDAGYVEVREPLTLPAWQHAEVAGELQDIAHELLAAAELAPDTEPKPERQGVL
jgi:hypothetical protein